MPARLSNLPWAPRAAVLLAASLALAQCGPARNEFAPLCPGRAILGDAADLDIYQTASTRRDLTDLVLHARIVGMQGTCQQGSKKDQLLVNVSIGVELTRGPAMSGREAEVPVFVAVVEGDTILDKRVFRMRAAFPSNVDRVTLTPGEISLLLPVSAEKTGPAYSILAGFQLAPDQIRGTGR